MGIFFPYRWSTNAVFKLGIRSRTVSIRVSLCQWGLGGLCTHVYPGRIPVVWLPLLQLSVSLLLYLSTQWVSYPGFDLYKTGVKKPALLIVSFLSLKEKLPRSTHHVIPTKFTTRYVRPTTTKYVPPTTTKYVQPTTTEYVLPTTTRFQPETHPSTAGTGLNLISLQQLIWPIRKLN